MKIKLNYAPPKISKKGIPGILFFPSGKWAIENQALLALPEEILLALEHCNNEVLLTIDTIGNPWHLVPMRDKSAAQMRGVLSGLFASLSKKHRSVRIHGLLPANEAAVENILALVFEELSISTYRVAKYRKKKPVDVLLKSAEVFLASEQKKRAQAELNYAVAVSEARMLAMDLVNAPSNYKTPEMIAKVALKQARKHGYKATVYGKKEITEMGLGALLAVNQGSALPPRFIVLEYKPKRAGRLSVVGLVGKGVTFDTGGISLKKNTNMHLLKSDMAGAAAVLGAVEAAATLKLKVHIVAIIPATDNKPDGNAVNPSDVITSYNGQTIEVIDTDAEGRLILADALAYMTMNFKPDTIIDLATLTGAAFIALGAQAAALFSNNDTLASALSEAGEVVQEKVWRMPLWKEYAKAMESSVADIKNYGGPAAGAVGAAKFLHHFVGAHPSWAHLDMAGLVLKSDASGERIATGYGVGLLTRYLKQLADG